MKKDDSDVQFITQIGTRNYNENTSKLYTDLSLITANEDIAINAQDVFKISVWGAWWKIPIS